MLGTDVGAGEGAAQLGEKDLGELSHKMQEQAKNDPRAQKKVEKLREVLGSTKEEQVEARKDSKGAERGAFKVKKEKGAKKCSGCEKVETSRGEFRICAACQNAVYCGRGKGFLFTSLYWAFSGSRMHLMRAFCKVKLFESLCRSALQEQKNGHMLKIRASRSIARPSMPDARFDLSSSIIERRYLHQQPVLLESVINSLQS